MIKIESTSHEKVKIVRLTNLQKLNSLSGELLADLFSALQVVDQDPRVKVIIITGNEKVFCAGADISNLNKMTYSGLIEHDHLSYIEKISYEISKPIIAAVSGFCFGGGFELALACDIIHCTKSAKFAFPEIKLGLFPGAGGTQRLSRLIGYYKASEVILTGDTYSVEEMDKFGVVGKVYENYDTMMKSVQETAERIASYSLMPIKTAKKALRASLETSLREGINIERNIFYGLFATEDRKIGTEAFLNKKKPEFQDR